MRRFLKHSLVFLGAFLILANGLSWMSLYFLRKSEFYKPSFALQKSKEKLDYIVLGSSTGLTTLDTQIIDSITGLQGVNLSMDDTSMPLHALMLEHFLAQGGKVSSCVLVFDAGQMNQQSLQTSGNSYRFLPFIQEEYVIEYFKAADNSLLSRSKWLPVIGVGYYNAELFYPGLYSAIDPKRHNRFDAKGNYSYPNSGGPQKRETDRLEFGLYNPWFKKIKTLCEANSIELILYHPPKFRSEVVSEVSVSNFINHSKLLQDAALFYDHLHVNNKGRQLTSVTFANEFSISANK